MNITVIGSGVIGLTSAIRLAEAGHTVKITAEAFPPDTTSDKAGAIWAPDAMEPIAKVTEWGSISYRVLCELANDPASGVVLHRVRQLEPTPIATPTWAALTNSVEHQTFTNYPAPFTNGFDATIPLIDVPTYMPYLLERFRELGGELEQRSLTTVDEVGESTDLLINCSGLGARQLAADETVFPRRGQTLLVTKTDPTPQAMHLHPDDLVVYIFPRHHDVLIGGTMQDNNWDLQPDPATAALMMKNAVRFEPLLADAQIIGHQVGLRPMRNAVRVELDQTGNTPIIHNYGHCGIGHSLAWGCAEEVVTLANMF